MIIYFAGPDIFRLDAQAWANEVRKLCTERGHTALIPLEIEYKLSPPAGIFLDNIALLQTSDAIIANLNPFRGAEPDSGTCVEVGYALALGKRVIGYVDSGEHLADRVERLQSQPLTGQSGKLSDVDGFCVEDFGLPLNLMLAVPCRIVVGGIQACLKALG